MVIEEKREEGFWGPGDHLFLNLVVVLQEHLLGGNSFSCSLRICALFVCMLQLVKKRVLKIGHFFFFYGFRASVFLVPSG